MNIMNLCQLFEVAALGAPLFRPAYARELAQAAIEAAHSQARKRFAAMDLSRDRSPAQTVQRRATHLHDFGGTLLETVSTFTRNGETP